jgi:hypothetical protein
MYPTGKSVPIPGKDRDIGAVCLAVLRRDGFISLEPIDRPGSVTTKRFALPAGRLLVNVDALGGELRVQLEDEKGQALARSAAVRGDCSRQEITWEQGGLERLVGRGVALHFDLRGARLYSYWFEP